MTWYRCPWFRTGSELSVIVLIVKFGGEESRRVFGQPGEVQGSSHHQPEEQQWGHQCPHCSQDVVALSFGAVLPRSLQVPSYLLVSGLQSSTRAKMLHVLVHTQGPEITQSNSRAQAGLQILTELYDLRRHSPRPTVSQHAGS